MDLQVPAASIWKAFTPFITLTTPGLQWLSTFLHITWSWYPTTKITLANTLHTTRRDQGTSHAVTTKQDLIFDSSQPQAIHLTKENVDNCCSTPFKQVTYVGIFQAYHFTKSYMINRGLFLKALPHQVATAYLDNMAQAACLSIMIKPLYFWMYTEWVDLYTKIFVNQRKTLSKWRIRNFEHSQMKMFALSSGYYKAVMTERKKGLPFKKQEWLVKQQRIIKMSPLNKKSSNE